MQCCVLDMLRVLAELVEMTGEPLCMLPFFWMQLLLASLECQEVSFSCNNIPLESIRHVCMNETSGCLRLLTE
jgi:hypothetical protein